MVLDTTYARAALSEDRIYAQDLDAVAWRTLQTSYVVGELLMPCCDAPAIPKTSTLGLQFFAHASGACGSSPESPWHQASKEAVAAAAKSLGYRLGRPKSWPTTQGILLSNLPAFTLRLENGASVHGPDMHVPLLDAIRGFCEDRYIWRDGRWLLDGTPIPYPRAP